ncbi:hypothetical protein [Paenibacillus glycanilyticus]|uniref:Uncharacterized protein n=1 Tax=Paenibacillus glycanilyticus TaxID=126569 RepID=A0ABQ6GB49_9BACL|nr:hypothetical protein [Paenibacillus glycanilyticus]GLX68194.1 hypothetical protein MU1_25390 [Paenibacillus glycanilyticus]
MTKSIAEWNEELEILREQATEKEHLERKAEQLQRLSTNATNRITVLKAEHTREQRDVDQLERKTWTSLISGILGNKDTRLEKERQEALAAALKLQEAQLSQVKLEQEKQDVAKQLEEFKEAANLYTQALRQKEQLMRGSIPEASAQLSEWDEQLYREHSEIKELREAASACRKLVEALSQANVKLDSAKDWGTYDMLGGGMISTSIKHSRIDDAQDYIYEAQHHLRQLQVELKDLKRTADLYVGIDTMDKFGDFFFDGLITDWIVQDKIKSSISNVEAQLSDATGLMVGLDNEVRASERRQAIIRQQVAAYIEQFNGGK